ncbi:MAG: ROK family protein [Eubacteriales bacterium]|nr:ROK family protein [Eubacteriales bacterium]
MRIAALDIGGTSIKSGIWDGTQLIECRETDTNAKEGGIRLMERAVEILESYGQFDGIGISTAGQVDTEKGSIYYANDNIPGYTGVEVQKIMEDRFHVPVTVENDVNAAAIGEGQYGAAAGQKDFLCLTYGTGVGGAIVLDGIVYSGSSYSAGSFGGIVVHPEKIDPEVEFSGCYEKYASATGLVKSAMELDPALTNGRLIFENFDRPEVKAVIDGWVDEIVWGLVSLVHSFNPGCIVLGGGVMAQPYVLEQVRARLIPIVSPGFRNLQVVKASLGNQAGMMGAVSRTMKKMGLV